MFPGVKKRISAGEDRREKAQHNWSETNRRDEEQEGERHSEKE